MPPDTETPTDTSVVDVLRAHEWDCRAKGCVCGWTQRGSAPRGMERVNHPHHVAGQLELWSQFGKEAVR